MQTHTHFVCGVDIGTVNRYGGLGGVDGMFKRLQRFV